MTGPAFSPDRWRRIEEIFQASLEVTEDKRDAFLRERCKGDDQLRLEVENLLANDYEESPLIGSIVDDATNSLLEEDGPSREEEV
jgi:serine/threonine-protein kinase